MPDVRRRAGHSWRGWAGGQVGRSPVVQWGSQVSSLSPTQAPAPQAAPQTLQTDPGANRRLHKRARPFLLLGAGALFFTAALLFPWESLWTGKETMWKKIGDKSKNLQGQLGSPVSNEKSSFPVIKQVRSNPSWVPEARSETLRTPQKVPAPTVSWPAAACRAA